MSKLRSFCAIARLTAAEAVRRPACLLLTLACVYATVLMPMLLMHNLGDAPRLARDGGLAFHFVLGLILTVALASSALSREVRGGTAAALLSKPVGRSLFYVAKVAGVSFVVIGYSCCVLPAVLAAERIAEQFESTGGVGRYVTDWQTGVMLLAAPAVALVAAAFVNYRRRRPFPSAAFAFLLVTLWAAVLLAGFFSRDGRWAPYALRLSLATATAGGLITLALLVLGTFAFAFSTRWGAAPTLMGCVAVFILGLMSD